MAGHKALIASQMYRQKRQVSVNYHADKAAKITGSSLPDKSQGQRERWGDVLHVYCDYFIRY